MAISNRTKLLDGTLRIGAGSTFINSFYNNFAGNLFTFIDSKTQLVIDKTREILRSSFKNTLSENEYENLLRNIINADFPSFQSPYYAWYLSSISDDDLTFLLTTGNLSSSEKPSEVQKKQITDSVKFLDSSVHNYESAMRTIHDNQYVCSFNYNGYAQNKQFIIDFSKVIDPSAIGGCLGLLINLDKQDIDRKDAGIVVNLIKCYSNTTFQVLNNSYSSRIQKNAFSNYNLFETRYNESIETYVKLPIESSNRTGSSNAPTNVPIRPIMDDNFIIKNNDALLSPSQIGISPSGITLNQFTQPNFSDILSILDIIRSDVPDTHIKQYTSTIVNEGSNSTIESATSTSSVTGTVLKPLIKDSFVNIVIPTLNTDERNSAKKSIEEAIKSKQKEIQDLGIQISKLSGTDEFILTAFVAGVGSSGLAEDTNNKKPDSEVLKKTYAKLAGALSGQQIEGETTPSANTLINNATWDKIKGLNEKFRVRLNIFAPVGNQISQNTIKEVYKKTDNQPPVEFNTIISLTNKSNIIEVNKNIQSIVQKVSSQMKSTESQRLKLLKDIENYKNTIKQIEQYENRK